MTLPPLASRRYLTAKSAIERDGRGAWPAARAFIADRSANLLERLAVAEQLVDRCGVQLTGDILAAAASQEDFAYALAYADLSDVEGVHALREWQASAIARMEQETAQGGDL